MTSPAEILADAQQLFSTARSGEARQRTVMSRCYYAAFHAGQNLARSRGFTRSADLSVGSHQELIGFLSGAREADLNELADVLKTLRRYRVLADYRIDRTVRWTDVEDSVQLSDTAVQPVG